MSFSREELGLYVKHHRDAMDLTQEDVAQKCGASTNRSAIAHLEQGIRLPRPEVLTSICVFLGIPDSIWAHFANPQARLRIEFESCLAELIGDVVNLKSHGSTVVTCAEKQINLLFSESHSNSQAHDLFNSTLVFYGIHPSSDQFFEKYLGAAAFSSTQAFAKQVRVFQRDGIRLFSTLREAYHAMNSHDLGSLLTPLSGRDVRHYSDRLEWKLIEEIPDARLPDLGYVSAERVRKESAERSVLKRFLLSLASEMRTQTSQQALDAIHEKTKRRMDSLLRKFNSTLQHGLFSPLFSPDPDEIERESNRLAPKSDDELLQMTSTQEMAMKNLAAYLAADYMDVYVATSMRSDSDFISVNHFARELFRHDKVKRLKLRYFNPTQSWIDDRIAKGLVEALMLRRAAITIYMAQKEDTFGKDSEASVALGQGKPVIVYVPKLYIQSAGIDSELLFQEPRDRLVFLASQNYDDAADAIDETVDNEALVGRILTSSLMRTSDQDLKIATRVHYADFDLYSETHRVPMEHRGQYREWLDLVIRGDLSDAPIPVALRESIVQILVAISIRFEKRATLFREIHPLALQVILSSGVLNGILVVRSVEQCAEILKNLIENSLSTEIVEDEFNYRLVETSTRSTIRVISRHKLLRNAFDAFYSK